MSRSSRLIPGAVSLVFLACWSVVLLSAQEAAPRRDPLAVEVLTQAFQAMGGAQKPVISDVRLEGTIARAGEPDRTVATFVAKMRGRDFAVDTLWEGEERSFRVLNGKGSRRLAQKTKELPDHNTLGVTLQLFPLFSRWTDFARPEVAVAYVGVVEMERTACHQIRLQVPGSSAGTGRPENRQLDVFVNAQTGLLVATRSQARPGRFPSTQVTVEDRFVDYQSIQGVAVPTRILRYRLDRPHLVIRVTSAQFNNGFTDVDFVNEGGAQ